MSTHESPQPKSTNMDEVEIKILGRSVDAAEPTE